MESHLLSAYGTLRDGGPPGLSWGRALQPLGRCVLRGALYDLGPYPGLLPGDGPVAGELLRIPHGQVLREIDRYEVFDPTDEARSEFVRRLTTVATPRGSVRAWVYYYNGPVDPRMRIRSGDWCAHRKDRPALPGFCWPG